MTRKMGRLTGLVLVIALVVGACGDDAPATTPVGNGTPAGGGLTGSIAVSGSSTVEPISARVAEAFYAANPEVRISVDGPGTKQRVQVTEVEARKRVGAERG